MIIEFLHRNSIFFGTISEYFLVVQFRRGVWISAMVSLIVIVKNSNIIFESLKENERLFLLGSGVAVYLAPYAVTILLLLVYILYIFNNRMNFLLFAVVSFMVYLNINNGHFIIEQQIKSGATTNI